TRTDQVADSGQVDIGYHFFAVSTNTTVTIQATTPAVPEIGGPPGVFTVTRTGSTNSSLTVFYNVGGTAVPGTNYTALSGSATIGRRSAASAIPPARSSSPPLRWPPMPGPWATCISARRRPARSGRFPPTLRAW